MERLKDWFAEQGLDAKQDIPKAIVIHEVLGAGMALAAWSACYAVQPSKTFFKPVNKAVSRNRFLEQTYSQSMVQAHKTVQAMTKRLPGAARWNTGRLTISLAESICFRAAVKPATFPFKLWASYKLVLATQPQAHKDKRRR